jgi:hypothetical protein
MLADGAGKFAAAALRDGGAARAYRAPTLR